jgi:hypothetical protein
LKAWYDILSNRLVLLMQNNTETPRYGYHVVAVDAQRNTPEQM